MTAVRLMSAGTWEEKNLSYHARILDFLPGAVGHVDATEQDHVEAVDLDMHHEAGDTGALARATLMVEPELRMVSENQNPPAFHYQWSFLATMDHSEPD